MFQQTLTQTSRIDFELINQSSILPLQALVKYISTESKSKLQSNKIRHDSIQICTFCLTNNEQANQTDQPRMSIQPV